MVEINQTQPTDAALQETREFGTAEYAIISKMDEVLDKVNVVKRSQLITTLRCPSSYTIFSKSRSFATSQALFKHLNQNLANFTK
jgi:hypothetical protein